MFATSEKVKPDPENIRGLSLVGKPERKGPLGRLRRKWMDNIKMDLREIGWDGIDWIALVNTVMNLRVP
jgi:hypothetical protein